MRILRSDSALIPAITMFPSIFTIMNILVCSFYVKSLIQMVSM